MGTVTNAQDPGCVSQGGPPRPSGGPCRSPAAGGALSHAGVFSQEQCEAIRNLFGVQGAHLLHHGWARSLPSLFGSHLCAGTGGNLGQAGCRGEAPAPAKQRTWRGFPGQTGSGRGSGPRRRAPTCSPAHALAWPSHCGLPARPLQDRTEGWEGAPGGDESRADRRTFPLQNTQICRVMAHGFRPSQTLTPAPAPGLTLFQSQRLVADPSSVRHAPASGPHGSVSPSFPPNVIFSLRQSQGEDEVSQPGLL